MEDQKVLKKWAVRWDAGMTGTDTIRFVEAYTQEEAEEYFSDSVHEHIDMYSCHWHSEEDGEQYH